MGISRLAALLSLLVLAACATTPAGAGGVDLRTLDSAPFALAPAERRATVLLFWSPGCPCVARYQDRMDAIWRAYGGRDVQVLAVSSNVDDDLETLRAHAPALPLVVDEGGRLAAQVGARSTPTAVVLDAAGEVRYRGWIDNERLPGDPDRKPWLEEALDDLLERGQVRRPAAPTWGCAITRSLQEVRRCHGPAAVEPAATAE